MNFYVYQQMTLQTKRCSLAAAQEFAMYFISQRNYWYGDDELEENPLYQFCQLAELILDETVKVTGSADDYHNIAVAYAKENLKDYACDILEKGLRVFPDSTDLLADYLQYGLSCGKAKECSEYFRRLSDISKALWTWRGFMFSVEYLLESLNLAGFNKPNRSEIFSLAEDFLKKRPFDEEADFTLAKAHHAYGEEDDERKVLENALKRHSVAAKCALRLADITFERGEYANTIQYAKRAIKNAVQPQHPVKIGYCYLLIALSQISILLEEETDSKATDSEQVKQKVEEIYENAHIAMNDGELNSALLFNLKRILKIVEMQFAIDNPYADEIE